MCVKSLKGDERTIMRQRLKAPPKPRVSGGVSGWAVVFESGADITFVDRQHRRRLSLTTKLALAAYHQCNPSLDHCTTVFASRYGEYARTYGLIDALAKGEPASPAAFSVSVHNAPAGILGMVTGNRAASSTVSATRSTVEAGFLEAMLHKAELPDGEDVILIYVDEPLPEAYGPFRAATDRAYALALRLATSGTRQITLSWCAANPAPAYTGVGVPVVGMELAALLDSGGGTVTTSDERLRWEWTIE